MPPDRGHNVAPHTADARLEAWGPTAAACYEEAVAALVSVFADVTGAPPGTPRPFRVGPSTPAHLAVLLLEEVLYALDVDGVVPVSTRVEQGDAGELAGTFSVVPVDDVTIVGSVVKGVSYGDLQFRQERDGWRCAATVDV